MESALASVEPVYVPSDVPTGRRGEWTVERFTLHPDPDRRRRSASSGRPWWLDKRPGVYTSLCRGRTLFMTDLFEEWWSQRTAVVEACRRGGEVLVTGLGLGLIVESMLKTPGTRVERITVVERAKEVIELVAPHLLGRYGDRLQIVHADARQWRPSPAARYSVVWHDIWPSAHDGNNLPEMVVLEDRYAPLCRWQGSWARDFAGQAMGRG